MLKPDARIVAQIFGIERWVPDKTVKLPEIEIVHGGRRHQHIIHLWWVRETGDY
jgi:hypothetical protein